MSDQALVAQLREFVAHEFLQGKDAGLDARTPLLEWGIIDSISIASLTVFIEERFGIRIPTSELKPANLANLGAIADMILRLQRACAE
jgi:acyl carrier protein